MSPDEQVDVLVIGAGPAGLSAATQLKARGIASVVVVDRETMAGGVPRHCGHPPFGMREFGRVLTGPAYARRLAGRATGQGVDIRLGHSVVGIERGDALVATVARDAGVIRIAAQRIILATGVRETPRAARLASGDRPLGVLSTGALQAYAYLQHLAPFRRPIIVGTELVALSALLTCRSIGAKPVAMIEERHRPTVFRAFMGLPRLLGVPVHYGAQLVDIRGKPRVEVVTLRLADGATRDIACDGVIFSGRFRPEATLARAAGLAIDPGTGGPAIDQFGRTTDPRIFAAGNVLRPVETAGWSWAEGRQVADFAAADIAGHLPSAEPSATISPGTGVRYVMPQRLVPGSGGFEAIQLRVADDIRGRLVATSAGATVCATNLCSGPERRILVPVASLGGHAAPIVIGTES